MPLRWNVILVLCGLFVLYAGIADAIQRFIVFPDFVSLERDEATKDLRYCVGDPSCDILRRSIIVQPKYPHFCGQAANFNPITKYEHT
jgi:hypothetical protein